MVCRRYDYRGLGGRTGAKVSWWLGHGIGLRTVVESEHSRDYRARDGADVRMLWLLHCPAGLRLRAGSQALLPKEALNDPRPRLLRMHGTFANFSLRLEMAKGLSRRNALGALQPAVTTAVKCQLLPALQLYICYAKLL